MALSVGLGKAGATPRSIKTSADVHLEKVNDAFTVTKIELSCDANVTGIDAAKFQEVAEATKKNCPVGRLLAATNIQLNAKLVG